MSQENLLYQVYAFCCRDVRKANQPTLRRFLKKNESTKVLVHRNNYSALVRCPFKKHAVTRVGFSVTGLGNIVALTAQPLRQHVSRAGVYEELHFLDTCTASSTSCAITARAYAKQACISTGVRSG